MFVKVGQQNTANNNFEGNKNEEGPKQNKLERWGGSGGQWQSILSHSVVTIMHKGSSFYLV